MPVTDGYLRILDLERWSFPRLKQLSVYLVTTTFCIFFMLVLLLPSDIEMNHQNKVVYVKDFKCYFCL